MNQSDQSKSFLSELLKLNKRDKIAIGYEKLSVTGVSAQSLASIPADANYMEIRVESATTTGVIMRYNLLGNSNLPTTTDGMGLTYLDLFDVSGRNNIINFRVIAVSSTHTIHIQYFK
jgi:hypothetical protein